MLRKLILIAALNCLTMTVLAQTTLTIATGNQTPGTSDCAPTPCIISIRNV